MIFPIEWFFSFRTFSLPMTSSTLPQPLFRSHIRPCVYQHWNPCMILHNFIFKLPTLTISSTNLSSLFLLVSHFQKSCELTRTNKVSILLLFHYLIARVFTSFVFQLEFPSQSLYQLLADALILFPLPYYIVFTYLQSWLKSILWLLHVCICLVGMTREKHTIMLTGFT